MEIIMLLGMKALTYHTIYRYTYNTYLKLNILQKPEADH